MTPPLPARDDTCPECGQARHPGYYGQRFTCGCGAHLIFIASGPTQQWTRIIDHDPQTGGQDPKRRPHLQQPARDDSCPNCGRDLATGFYGQRRTCSNCGTWLIYAMGGPAPRWIRVRDYDPQTGGQDPKRRPHSQLTRAYPPKEKP